MCSLPAIFSAQPGRNRSCSPIPVSAPTRSSVIADGHLAGAVLYGDTADAPWYLDLIRTGAAIESFREDLVFGRALAERRAA